MKTRLIVIAITFWGVPTLTNAYTPIFNNTHVLSNGGLSVEVMDPIANDRQDTGIRFSPLAWFIQANYRDIDYFYAPADPLDAPWNNNPNRYPGGSPMEFDSNGAENEPPGYNEATIGGADEFLKIGVGMLRRATNATYSHANNYELVGVHNQVTWAADRATFTQTLPRETNTGYRYELETVMRLVENRLILDYRLTNNGSNAFQTSQYLHNFTSINGSKPSSSTIVEVPWSFAAEGNLTQAVIQQGNQLVYLDNIGRSRRPKIRTTNLGNASYEFTVRQTDLDEHYIASAEIPEPIAGATADATFVAVWNDSDGTQISPEQFVLLSLDPGKSIAWSRTYTFGTIPEPPTCALGLTLGLVMIAAGRNLL